MVQLLIPQSTAASDISEFYKREFGFEAKVENTFIREPIPPNSILFCYGIQGWKNRLEQSHPNSVSVILSANETYDINKYRELNRFDAIKFAFIDHLPEYPVKIPWVEVSKWISENSDCLRERHFWGTLKHSVIHVSNLRRFKFRFPTMRMPVGYSERFVKELELSGYNFGQKESLLGISPLSSPTGRDGVSFMGQKGTWYRRRMISQFDEMPGAQIETYSSWGGNPVEQPKADYVKSILRSKFVICPPGNVSSESFRYMESIILGAIPILTEVSVQDFTRHNYWPKDSELDLRTYLTLWGNLQKKSEDELSTLYFALLRHLNSEIASIKKHISRLTGTD